MAWEEGLQVTECEGVFGFVEDLGGVRWAMLLKRRSTVIIGVPVTLPESVVGGVKVEQDKGYRWGLNLPALSPQMGQSILMFGFLRTCFVEV